MEKITHVNGVTYKLKTKLFVFRYFVTFEIYKENRKNLLFQFNRFENGYCTIYLRLFKRYSIYISDIKVSEGKEYFLGNKEKY